ncbi:2-dehydro-3-deoxyphosphooctonate aldolase [Tenacibaculum holothuriorum]|uniref:2-dehydro-3-deoxyphosphooctonate aldolase n=1 Tax=Tenacibaculum holothuriorum TaxID=1635173 RepID=A0A1Y2PDF6_9FLAO|nr:DUF1801 domain-containing protein [Tenacibaculum holothuriorum]OSY88513.1 2-dehydro-3-deoxyphosphooctonate aldolase [Tenacibaculum holothuriorum]
MKPAEEYILQQPEPFKSILLHIQVLLETHFPDIEMKYKWRIPVYYLNGKQLCYLNASHKKGYIDVGFWAKGILEEYETYLVSEGRTVVKSLRYTSIEDINGKILLKVATEVSKHNHKGFWKK